MPPSRDLYEQVAAEAHIDDERPDGRSRGVVVNVVVPA
jgi:hypothetical protein